MTQKERDDAYENGAFIENAADYPARWQAEAAAFRGATPCDLDISYGPHPRACYDLFWPEATPHGLMVFVHGGYWKARAKSDWSHFAGGGLARGYAVAMVGYPLAPEVRIHRITEHVAQAITAVSKTVEGEIFLTGHSAGGHLVSRMVMPGVLREAVSARVVRSVPISPISDLRPLLDLSMNEILRLDAQEAASESPVLGAKRAGTQVHVVVGAEERDAFLDQSRWLAEAWQIAELILPKCHHFNVIDGLLEAQSPLMSCVFGDP